MLQGKILRVLVHYLQILQPAITTAYVHTSLPIQLLLKKILLQHTVQLHMTIDWKVYAVMDTVLLYCRSKS